MDLFVANKDYFEYRKSQIEPVLEFVQKQVALKGKKLVSLGCGVAPELHILDSHFSEKIGIDLNQTAIDFCRKNNKRAEFLCINSSAYLEKLNPESVDCILALDIDLNIFPEELVKKSLNVLGKNGFLVLTERKGNLKIYGRYVLSDVIEEMKDKASVYELPSERDRLLVIIQKKQL